MTIELSWTTSSQGFSFRLQTHQEPIPIAAWANQAPPHLLPGVGLLLGWLDQQETESAQPDVFEVPHGFVAALSDIQAKQLGLPAVVPFVLNIGHEGLPTDPGFRFQYHWRRTNSRPVLGARRVGALLQAGGLSYRLPEPVYSLLEGMDAFNVQTERNPDGGFRAWEKLRVLLDRNPGVNLRLDDFLKTTRVVCAAHFTLDIGGSLAAPEFDPAPLNSPPEGGSAEGGASEPREMLPPHYQSVFARRFHHFRDARPRYVLEDGWYLVLSEGMREALVVVKHYQNAAPEARREFVRNPHAALHEALSGRFDEAVIESLFDETFIINGRNYSERVRDSGFWQPKVLPWLKKQSGETWLPPEELGLQIDGKRIPVKAAEVDELLGLVEDAMAKQQPFVEWQGEAIPAGEKTREALQTLIGRIAPPPNEAKPEERKVRDPVTVLLLSDGDNLETLGYRLVRVERGSSLRTGVPSNLQTPLKPHQKDGLAWLQSHWRRGSPGVLLADDMGLGKTVQALSFLAWLKQGMEAGILARRPLLVVAPTGLLKNWEEEHGRHLQASGLGKPVRAYGADLLAYKIDKPSNETRQGGRILLKTDRLREADWILTTYETLRDYQHSFGQIAFAAIVFDEAQKIKTPGVMLTEAAKAMNAGFVLAMTGTPVENRLSDLWCIVDTAHPGLLGELKAFCKRYESDSVDLEALARLKNLLLDTGDPDDPRPMLRRLKSGSLRGLPEKTEHVLPGDMPPAQALAYSQAVQSAYGKANRGAMLETLHALRSISLHPYHQAQDGRDAAYLEQSARLACTFGILDRIREQGEKALIFLESLDMQGYLSALIQRYYSLAEAPMLINGTVTGPKRQERVRHFQTRPGFDVMILSPRAGGVGITLTAANHVIHLSRWWNPAVEDQCTDRVYRIGQDKPVHVYYPLAIHPELGDFSFDRRLHELLLRKRHLSRELLAPSAGSERELNDLFRETVNPIEMPDFDSMEPLQFEHWVLRRLQEAGFTVRGTPVTGDGAADGVAFFQGQRNRCLIVQCKHTQRPELVCDATAIDDLLRARERYRDIAPDSQLCAVTNAHSFNRAAQERAQEKGIRLVVRNELADWVNLIIASLRKL